MLPMATQDRASHLCHYMFYVYGENVPYERAGIEFGMAYCGKSSLTDTSLVDDCTSSRNANSSRQMEQTKKKQFEA